jgi:predicted TIM-barrel fold metal-dependent hydrolase
MPEENVRADKLGGTAKRRNTSMREVRSGENVDYKYISADNHIDLVWYPRDIIQSRIESKFKDRAPKIVESPKGTAWTWEDDIHAFAADGKDWAKYAKRFDPIEVEEGRLPPSDPEILIQHMDIGEFYAGVYYGNTRKWVFKDKELEKAVYRAFNSWALEVCAYSPDRLIVLPWLHAAFPEFCADEVYRLADQGVRAVELSPNDMAGGVWSPVWEPVWAAAEETGMVICTHIGDTAGTPYPPNEYGQSLAHFSQVPFNPAGKHIAQFVFSGMFDRHPNLHVSVAECRIGWLPFLFQWMQRCYSDRAPDSIHQLEQEPLHYLKNNMSFTFEEDYIGAKMIPDPEFLIRDSVIWGCDYPHEQGQTWPDATPAMERMFTGVDPDLVHEVVWGRSQRIFGIQGPNGSNGG